MPIEQGFGALAPMKERLQDGVDLNAALKIIYREEGYRKFRIGIDKRGRYSFFSAPIQSTDRTEWIPGTDLSGVQYRNVRDLVEAGQLQTGNGPPWCHLVYSKHETVPD